MNSVDDDFTPCDWNLLGERMQQLDLHLVNPQLGGRDKFNPVMDVAIRTLVGSHKLLPRLRVLARRTGRMHRWGARSHSGGLRS